MPRFPCRGGVQAQPRRDRDGVRGRLANAAAVLRGANVAETGGLLAQRGHPQAAPWGPPSVPSTTLTVARTETCRLVNEPGQLCVSPVSSPSQGLHPECPPWLTQTVVTKSAARFMG